MDNDLLQSLLAEVDKPIARYAFLESYYSGNQQNGFLSQEQRELLGNRLSRLAVNIPRLCVGSIAERLSVRGFKGVDVWDDWIRNDFDMLQDVVHREVLTLGEAWVIVWQRNGKPFLTVESSWSMACVRDFGTREITAAIKRYETDTSTEAVVFTPDKIFKLRALHAGAKVAQDFRVYETLDNPLQTVPVVCFQNMDRFESHSELDDLVDLVDGLSLALADLAIAQAYSARQTQYATGVALTEKPVLNDDGSPVLDGNGAPVMSVENPFPPTNRMHIAESSEAEFGQLTASDLSGFEAAVRIWLSAIQAVSSLPASALGILSDQPVSADSLRAASQSLEAKAQSRGAVFGRSWEQVAKLTWAIKNPGVSVSDVDVRVVWRDFGVNSFGVEADGITKLYAAKLISRSSALSMLGWDESEILADRAAMRAESLDSQGVALRPTITPNVPQSGPEPQESAA